MTHSDDLIRMCSATGAVGPKSIKFQAIFLSINRNLFIVFWHLFDTFVLLFWKLCIHVSYEFLMLTTQDEKDLWSMCFICPLLFFIFLNNPWLGWFLLYAADLTFILYGSSLNFKRFLPFWGSLSKHCSLMGSYIFALYLFLHFPL